MWFKRRKKTEQDHALSESLRSLQSLLSENGRREPTLDPKRPQSRSGTGDDEPEPRAGQSVEAGARTPPAAGGSDEPAASESGNRWQDLNLSFDAEPISPRARRDHDTAEPEEPEDSALAESDSAEPDTETDSTGDPGDRVEETALLQGGPVVPDTGAAAPGGDTDTAAAAEPVTEATDDDAPAPLTEDDTEADPVVEVVYYDDMTGLVSGDEENTETGAPQMRGDEPDLEIDLSEAETMDSDVLPEAGELQAPAETDDVSDEEPPEAQALDDAPAVDTAELSAAPVADIPAVDSGRGEAAADTGEPGSARRDEDQLHLELGLDEVSEDDIPTLTDVVFMPDSGTGEDAVVADAEPTVPASRDTEEPADEVEQPVETGLANAPEPAAEPELPADPEPVDEPLEPEPPEVPAETAREAESVPPPEPPAETTAAPEQAHAAIPDPGRLESPHDEKVENCVDNLRVRLQLMGLDALSPEQEKELHDTLVDFLDDLGLD